MIDIETLNKLNQIKGNHRIGVAIPKIDFSNPDFDFISDTIQYPCIFICDADDPNWKIGIPYSTPDWLYDWLEVLGLGELGKFDELLESYFEFIDTEICWEILLLADEVRYE